MGLRIREQRTPRADLKLCVHRVPPPLDPLGVRRDAERRGLGSAVAALACASRSSGFTTSAQGVTTVTIPVDGDTTPTGTGNWTADLGCQPGSCANVYPVKVTLTDSGTGAGSGAQLITYLVYDDPSSTSQPLRLALGGAAGAGPGHGRGAGRVPAVRPGRRPPRALVGVIEGRAAVPVTLAPDPATARPPGRPGPTTRRGAWPRCRGPRPARPCPGPFVPVDAGALVARGLPGELTAPAAPRGARCSPARARGPRHQGDVGGARRVSTRPPSTNSPPTTGIWSCPPELGVGTDRARSR